MKYKKLMFLLGLAIFFSSATMAQNYKYIGAAKCKMCHNKPDKGEQFNKWEAGPHAKAMETLKGDEKEDPKCLKCHSTAASVDKSLVATIKVDEGVSCESCHGPGSIYKSAAIMKNQKLALSKGMIMPTEEVCIQCHNDESPTFKGFNYDEYVAKIAHDDPTTN
ncbi:cytochrome C554 [Maribellus comscasis]|uniref:Cytochrome C554 n=1 Tax=Maribellus comscasis TaxID=2681766 RepID=A0A6I6JZK8_9BACT|nr:cytochrome c family protein [Maribellus comscasis]QGY46600.1 cytochrome C554 [Maribellus comscasis]